MVWPKTPCRSQLQRPLVLSRRNGFPACTAALHERARGAHGSEVIFEGRVDHIAKRFDRNKTSVWDEIDTENHDGIWGVGRKASLSAADTDKLVAFTKSILKTANVRYTVTAEMIQTKFTPKACWRVLRNVLHRRKIWFRKLRRSPFLTDEGAEKRYKWAQTFRNKPGSGWRNHVQVHIHNQAQNL